jgi:hypothetical protein
MLQLLQLQIGTNCTSHRREVGLASYIEKCRTIRANVLIGICAEGESLALAKRHERMRKQETDGQICNRSEQLVCARSVTKQET